MNGLGVTTARRRNIGLASGVLTIVAINTAFATLALLAIGSDEATGILFAVVAISAVFMALGVAVIRSAIQEPLPPRTDAERTTVRRFNAIAAADILAIFIGNGIAVTMNRREFIVVLDFFIVGLYFFPLAWLFRVPRYYVTGVLFCGIAILTTQLTPSTDHIGRAFTWYVFPSLGCTLVSWLTAVSNLREAWQPS